ncbi:MAG: hypothetical protein IRZ00_17275, partial [Gemmatimonadetes bacterium]|nr:hypothetical protein [Gemmatimonadota bacterium]
MTKTRLPLAALVASTLVVGAAYASAFLPGGAPAWAPWALVVGMAGSLVAIMALGAARPGRGVGRLALPFAFTFVVLVSGFGLALALPPEGAATPLLLGLPRRAAIVMYGIGLLPLLVLPLAYVRTFDDFTLTEDDLRRVREARRAFERTSGGAGDAESGRAADSAGPARDATTAGPSGAIPQAPTPPL